MDEKIVPTTTTSALYMSSSVHQALHAAAADDDNDDDDYKASPETKRMPSALPLLPSDSAPLRFRSEFTNQIITIKDALN